MSSLGVFIPSALGSLGGVGKSSKAARKIGPLVATITIDERHQDDLIITDHPVEQGAAISDHAYKQPAEVTIRAAWSDTPAAASGLLGSGLGGIGNSVLQGQVGNLIQRSTHGLISGSGVPPAIGNVLGQNFISGAVSSFGAIVNTGTGAGSSSVKDIYQQLLKLQTQAIPFDIFTGKRSYTNMLLRSITVETSIATENSLLVTLVCRQVIIVQTTVVSVGAPAANQAAPQKTQPPADNGTKQVIAVDPSSNPGLTGALTKAWAQVKNTVIGGAQKAITGAIGL